MISHVLRALRSPIHPAFCHQMFLRLLLLGILGLLSLSLPTNSIAALASVDFTPPLFDIPLTHDGGSLCGVVQYSSPVLVDLDGDGKLETVIGTVKNISAYGSYAACLVVINSNGTIRWSRVMPGSVNSSPAVGDINGDGQPDIVVGLGAENEPPTTGGVIAYDRNGNQLWYYQTADRIGGGGGNGQPNGLADGAWASPAIVDVNHDGTKQVLIGTWDSRIHLIDGATGRPFAAPSNNPWPAEMLDTIWSSAAVADLRGDGSVDFIFGGDMSANGAACTSNGGVLRVMHNIPGAGPTHLSGFDSQFGCIIGGAPTDIGHYGKMLDQSIYSSPAVGDFGSRGKLIFAGSGCAFPAGTNCSGQGNGHWVKVWDQAGNEVASLPTDAPVFASPALADVNNDGTLDIIVTTMGTGWRDGTGQGGTLFVWSGAPGFPLLWSRKPKNTVGLVNYRIPSSPTVADLNGDGFPEILFGYIGEIEVFDHNGAQLTETTGVVRANIPTLWLGRSTVNSTPAVGDLDKSGTIKIVAGGSNCVAATGFCDNIGRVRIWSASVLGLLNPPAAGQASRSRMQWPMFRHDPAHQGFTSLHAHLAPVAPASITLASKVGSSVQISANITVINTSALGTNYTVTYSSRLSGPTSGYLGANTSVSIPFSADPSGLGVGSYALSVAINTDATVENGSQTVPVTLKIFVPRNIFLPLVRR